MSEFKYRFVNLILLAALGFGIYWAFSTIDNSIIYSKDSDVITSNENIDYENSKNEEDVLFDNTKEEKKDIDINKKEEEKKLSPEIEVLIGKLNGLTEDRVYMKKGSRGTRVGTVQEFLNIYFDTSKTIDNDYGPGTMSDIKDFQNSEGLEADGLAGPETYEKMISILTE